MFTHVQGVLSSSGASSVTSLTATLGSTPVARNLLICGVILGGTNTTKQICKDSNNNFYVNTRLTPYLASGGFAGIYYLIAPSNATTSVTLSWTSSISGAIWVDEFGTGGANVILDTEATATGGPAVTMNTPSITPGTPTELLYAIGSSGSSNVTAPTANGTLGIWTGTGGGPDSATGTGGGTEYLLSSSSGSSAVQFTQAASSSWASMVAAFKISFSAIVEEYGQVTTFGRSV